MRAFVKAGRARPMVGNLLDKNAVTGIGAAAKKLGVSTSVLHRALKAVPEVPPDQAA